MACVRDEKGHIIRRERIEGNRVEGFQGCLNGERARAVIEANWNWTKIYDILEGLEGLEEVVPANPLRTRLIADAQIKTDKVDAAALVLTALYGKIDGDGSREKQSGRRVSHIIDMLLPSGRSANSFAMVSWMALSCSITAARFIIV